MKEPALALPRNAILLRRELEGGRVSHGYVAFSDIKGFTSLTEGLKKLGKDGAEVIATKIDELMLPIARAAAAHGGNIIAVEGDALLVSFESRDGLLGFCAETRPLARRVIDTPVGSFPVSLDIGIASGLLYEFIASSGGRRAYVVAGEAIDNAYSIEKKSDGDVVADAPYAEAEKLEGGGYRLRLGGAPQEAPVAFEPPVDDYTLSFMPQLVREGAFNEFLPVTAAFCDFDLIARLVETGSLSRASDAINELFAETQRIVELAGGGMIDKFKGYNSLLLFGAPQVHADDSRRALEAVMELKRAADRIARRHGLEGEYGHTGLNRGVVFCGEVCGRYTVMGDAVNTAARIKEASRGDIFISDKVLEDIGGAETKDAGRLALRGKREKVRVHSFVSFSEAGREGFVLRKDELDWLLDRVRSASKERGRCVNVIGDIGSGKDKLLTKLAEGLAEEGIPALELRTTPIQRTDPYRTVIELVKRIEGANSDEELMGALGISSLRDQKALEEYEKRLLARPMTFVLSNGDNSDRESVAFLGSIMERAAEARVSVVASCSSRAFEAGDSLTLEPLGLEESVSFARHLSMGIHGTSRFKGDTLGVICQRAEGNPMFIAELVKAAKRTREGVCFDSDIPEKLEQLLLSNITRLPRDQRHALKLYSLMYNADERVVDAFGMRKETEALISAGMLTSRLEFANDVLRKVVADQIPGLDKRDYYTRIASVCDATGHGDALVLSYYYSNADTTMPAIRAKAVMYLDRYVKGLGDLSVVRVDSLEMIAKLADRKDATEKRICVEALLGMCKFRHVNATKETDYRGYFDIAREASKLSQGEEYEYKALLETGRALCWLKKFKRGFALMAQARERARAAGDLTYYGNISSTYGYALSYMAGKPAEAVPILEETERVLAESIAGAGEIDRESAYTIASIYFALAECHNKLNNPWSAIAYLKKAMYYSEQFDVHHIYVQALGTMGEAYYNLGKYRDAEQHCLIADHVMEQRRVQMRHFRKELYVLLSMIYEKMGLDDRRETFKALAAAV